jgi:hypothetical protein
VRIQKALSMLCVGLLRIANKRGVKRDMDESKDAGSKHDGTKEAVVDD